MGQASRVCGCLSRASRKKGDVSDAWAPRGWRNKNKILKIRFPNKSVGPQGQASRLRLPLLGFMPVGRGQWGKGRKAWLSWHLQAKLQPEQVRDTRTQLGNNAV